MKKLYDKENSYELVESKDLNNFVTKENFDQELKEYLKKTGGTVEGDINVKGNLSTTNLRIHEADGTPGVTGYVHFMTIKITGNYVNKPIVIEVVRRRDVEPTSLHIQFMSGATTDPELQSFIATGNRNCKNAFYLYKASSGTWYLFGQKAEAYDSITVYRVSNAYHGTGINIEYVNNHYSAVPNAYTQAQMNNFYTIEEVKSLFNSLFVTQTFTVSDASKVFEGTANWATSVAKSGYTPLAITGIMGQGNLSSFINFYNWFLDGTTAKIYARMLWNDFHNGSAAASGSDFKIRFTVLYRKNF